MFRRIFVPLLFLALGCAAREAGATYHMWRIDQLYSNGDGSVQFVVVTALSAGQQFIQGHTLTSSQGGATHSFTFPSNLPGDSATVIGGGYYGGEMTTDYRSFLIGTQGFAALHLVTPDYVVPNGFLFTGNASVSYGEGVDVFSYAGLPTDGNTALYRNGVKGPDVATNFSGATASVTVNVVDYTGAWASAAEPGWGLSVIRGTGSNALGIVLYSYEQNHTPSWYILLNGSWTNATTYSGTLFRFSGPSPGETYNATLVSSAPAGSATLAFSSATAAVLNFTIGSVTQTKNLTRLQF